MLGLAYMKEMYHKLKQCMGSLSLHAALKDDPEHLCTVHMPWVRADYKAFASL